jgi:DNA-binding HxlR family transcriptional regulator
VNQRLGILLAMTGYGQFCAVARALEVLGERWTLLIVRELMLGATTFTDVRRGLPRIPRATLAARLRGLERGGIVEVIPGRTYRLTEAGTALAPVMRELARWATVNDRAALSDDDLDTAALTWDIRRRINRTVLPARTVVVALDFTDRDPADRYFWLHLSRNAVNLCRDDTGAPGPSPDGGSARSPGHVCCSNPESGYTATARSFTRCSTGSSVTCSPRMPSPPTQRNADDTVRSSKQLSHPHRRTSRSSTSHSAHRSVSPLGCLSAGWR